MEEKLEKQEKDTWIKIFSTAPSRNNLQRIKDGAHVINLNDKKSKGTYWVSVFIVRNTAVYFDSIRTEYIPKKY